MCGLEAGTQRGDAMADAWKAELERRKRTEAAAKKGIAKPGVRAAAAAERLAGEDTPGTPDWLVGGSKQYEEFDPNKKQ